MSTTPERGATPPSTVSRRREIGATSARSLLLTVLGEFVLPSGHPVWTRTLVAALAALGVEEKSARQALARTASDGVLVSARAGRQVRWSLSPEGRRLLDEGAARIYAHGAARPGWDGRWLVLVVSVPEEHRRLRHQLRTRLAWTGLGSPSPGVWVGPDTARADEVRDVLADVGAADAFVVVGEHCAGMPRADLAARAWDLTDLGRRYVAFLDRFEPERPDGDTATLAAQTALVDAWRRFPFLDPGLPDELLPPDWPGHRAAALFHARHEDWQAGAHRAWAALEHDAGGPDRVGTTTASTPSSR